MGCSEKRSEGLDDGLEGCECAWQSESQDSVSDDWADDDDESSEDWDEATDQIDADEVEAADAKDAQ